MLEGHFPGHPVLPGVAILHDLVLSRVRALRPGLRAVKFRRLIVPPCELRLELDLSREHEARFTVRTAGEPSEVHASGRLLFEPSGGI